MDENRPHNWHARRAHRQEMQNQHENHHVKRRGNPVWGFLKTVVLIIVIIAVAIFLWSFINAGSSVFHYVMSQSAPLGQPLKSADGRVNVLLLGIGGGTHDGADLTDSIIIASYNLKTNQSFLISIPRDLWITTAQAKVNTLYEVGKLKKTDADGLKYAEDKIDDMLGIPIQYGVLIDFDGFAKAIDQVGGLDINVADTFDDYEYPITGKENDMCGYNDTTQNLSADQAKQLNVPPGNTHVYVDPQGKISTDSATLNFDCRFEHIHFDKGIEHMDGTTALKFVRSRHGNNGEGSDFARSKRQQLVLQAFREKTLSVGTIADPTKISGLVDTLGQSIVTDIPADKYLDFYNLSKKMTSSESIVLGDLGDGQSVLINPPLDQYGGAWVLVPPNDDFTDIQKYLKDHLNGVSASPSPTPTLKGK